MRGNGRWSGIALLFGLALGGCAEATLFERTCSTCHSTAAPLAIRRTRTEWEVTVERMSRYRVERGMGPIAPADQKAIVEYLLKNGGKR